MKLIINILSLESGILLLFDFELVLLQRDRDEHLGLGEQVLGGVRLADAGSNPSLTFRLKINNNSKSYS